MSDFSLNQLVRDTIRQSASPDPYTIAKEVADQIPRDSCRLVLADLLPGAVREQIRALRHLAPPDKLHETPAPRGTRTGSNRSRKGDKIRKLAASPFTWRVAIPPKSEWKFLGELNRDECVSVADDYFSKASSHTVTGEQYRRLAESLDVDQTVSELGEERFWMVWRGEAA